MARKTKEIGSLKVTGIMVFPSAVTAGVSANRSTKRGVPARRQDLAMSDIINSDKVESVLSEEFCQFLAKRVQSDLLSWR